MWCARAEAHAEVHRQALSCVLKRKKRGKYKGRVEKRRPRRQWRERQRSQDPLRTGNVLAAQRNNAAAAAGRRHSNGRRPCKAHAVAEQRRSCALESEKWEGGERQGKGEGQRGNGRQVGTNCELVSCRTSVTAVQPPEPRQVPHSGGSGAHQATGGVAAGVAMRQSGAETQQPANCRLSRQVSVAFSPIRSHIPWPAIARTAARARTHTPRCRKRWRRRRCRRRCRGRPCRPGRRGDDGSSRQTPARRNIRGVVTVNIINCLRCRAEYKSRGN